MTGQAFEDMQEQNIRLMQQLREKDDANFKLMSERIKSNQIHKLLKEEKEELADQLLTLKTQVSYYSVAGGRFVHAGLVMQLIFIDRHLQLLCLMELGTAFNPIKNHFLS